MSTYSLNIYALDAAITNVADIITQAPTGQQWDWQSSNTPTLEVDRGSSPTQVTISDTDGDRLFSDDTEGQALTEPLTINGVTWPAGSTLQDEYEIDLTDGATIYRFVAVSVRVYSDPYTYEDTIIGFTWEGEPPPGGATLSYVTGSWTDVTSMVPCFTPGARILTAEGSRPVETLRPGDLIVTADHGLQPLLWIGGRALQLDEMHRTPGLRPIRIAAGALGAGMPERDLIVSPQHRVLIRSRIAARIGGAPELLVAAKHLLGLPGIAALPAPAPVRYLHLLLSRHEVIFADGAATETLLTGAQAMQGLTRIARAEIRAIFSTRMPLEAARPLPTGRLARTLGARHAKNGKPLVAVT